jgi:hypothetical protein
MGASTFIIGLILTWFTVSVMAGSISSGQSITPHESWAEQHSEAVKKSRQLRQELRSK